MKFPTISFYALFILLMTLVIPSGCTNNKMPEEQVDPDSIFFDYLAWGDEESGTVTLKLQYRAGSRNQAAVLLKSPAKVELDGEVLQADSTNFTGAYYEVIRRASEFGGKHSIVFTDINQKKYSTEFEFPIITLKNEVDSIVPRGRLVLRLANLKPMDQVRVILTDTSFYGRGIERVDTMYSDSMVISEVELHALRKGPVHLEIFREEEKSLTETMAAGGRFYITYSLKREFTLVDSVK